MICDEEAERDLILVLLQPGVFRPDFCSLAVVLCPPYLTNPAREAGSHLPLPL